MNHPETIERQVQVLTALAEGDFREKMNVMIGEAIMTQDLLEGGLSMCVHKDRRISFRVSWGVDWAYWNNREAFIPHHGRLTANFLASDNESTRRIYGKIVHDLLRREVPEAFAKKQDIAEKAFDLLVSPEVKVASKVWAMEILYILSGSIDWVAENLAPTVEHQAALSPTPAMTNHAGKLLKRISSNK